MDFSLPYPSTRSPVLGRNMVATSQPLAAQAGLSVMQAGGNAIDAAIAAAMALTVVEPTGCGIGSDAFAIIWDGHSLHGLNASGRAPAAWTPERFAHLDHVPMLGWNAVTVPGAVSAWVALAERFGRLKLTRLAEPAIRLASEGYPVSPIIATLWGKSVERLAGQPGFLEAFTTDGAAPRAGQVVRLPHHAASLQAIAETNGAAFYRGALTERMVAHSAANGGAHTAEDFASHTADWVGTIAQGFAGHAIHEIPPNGQGIVTLMALGIVEALGIGDAPVDDVETLHLMIEATKLAVADAEAHVADAAAMRVAPGDLLDPGYLAGRARLVDRAAAGDPGAGTPRRGGTVYLATADAEGRMVSFIQSNYMGFGSGVVVPGTGISLQNRGWGFSLDPASPKVVAPGKRPFHTIIPGFAMTADGRPAMSFGVMGGPMQPQGHLQMAVRTLLYGQNPQAAADAPRWRITGGRGVAVEATFPPALAEALRAKGHAVTVEPLEAVFGFGGAQAIMVGEGGTYVGGSDPRKDGHAVAF